MEKTDSLKASLFKFCEGQTSDHPIYEKLNLTTL